MSWCWFNHVDDIPPSALASAEVSTPDGDPAGWFAAWDADDDGAPDSAARIDDRLIDTDGQRAWVSYTRAPHGVSVNFDDPAVVEAMRRTLLAASVHAMSTLIVDAMHYGGSIRILHAEDPGRLATDDPFGSIFRPRLLRVGAGLFGPVPAPAGPAAQRYGATNPWPNDRF